jgi:ATP-dependent Lon protease
MKPYLGMTGEITLRGAVLPIGGVREKVMAASRAGLTTIILPKRNERDLVELPENVKKHISFKFIEEISEVCEIALEPEALKPKIETKKVIKEIKAEA